jgi:hypothetical protein
MGISANFIWSKKLAKGRERGRRYKEKQQDEQKEKILNEKCNKAKIK